MTAEATIRRRADYPHFLPIATRWMDNDVYGHVNNVVYYAYFDTVINRYLIDEGGLDIAHGESIGLCVESHCAYLEAVAFPDALEAGLRVAPPGSHERSLRDRHLRRRGATSRSAHGWFVHVFVDRVTRRPAPLPASIRAALERLTARSGP